MNYGIEDGSISSMAEWRNGRMEVRLWNDEV